MKESILQHSVLGNIEVFHHTPTGVLQAIGLTVFIIGLGLFESNVIQFGLDQLLEAPTPKLIAFIHWYYWAQSVGGLALFYMYGGYQVTSMTFLESQSSQQYHHGWIWLI